MNRIDSMLGLATKAGKTGSGAWQTEEAIRKGRAQLVLISEDAEKNTVKTLEDKCRTRHVPVRRYGTKEHLGAVMGKELRSCAVITDAGFAERIARLIDAAGKPQEERGYDGKDENQ